MMRTSVAISAASSRPDSDQLAKRRQVTIQDCGRVLLGKALQGDQEEGLPGRGVICVRWCSGEHDYLPASAFSFTGTEFQIFVNSR